ncbi:choice-of-anchor D domain-containing protein [Candidatus Latescibacterota bacterium]
MWGSEYMRSALLVVLMAGVCYGVQPAQATITTVVGNGNNRFTGDDGPATEASLNGPSGVFVDASGNIYIADTVNHRIRKVDGETGIIGTVAGGAGFDQYFEADVATNVSLEGPAGVFVDDSGNIFIAGSKGQVQRVDSQTNILTAVATGLDNPADVYVDALGNIYIAEWFGHRILMVDEAGVITTVAGNGNKGSSGDGGAAISASLDMPTGVYVDALGNIYIAERGGNRIRKVDGETGIIATVVGDGGWGPSGDGGPATSARLGMPSDIFVKGSRAVYVADFPSNQLSSVEHPGDLYIAETGNNRIRKVAGETGIIATVAGNGDGGFSGDGGTATDANLSQPADVFVDGNGAIYIADSGNNRIRMVAADPLAGVSEEGGIELNRREIEFANQQVGEDGAETLTVTNMNSSTFQLVLSLAGDGAFGLSTDELTLEPGASQTIGFTFSPPAAGDYAATLEIAPGSSRNEWVSVALRGKGTEIPRMGISKERVLFDIAVGVEGIEELFFSNEGTFSFDVMLSLEGDDAFKLSAEELTLAPGAMASVRVAFAASSLSEHEATLTIEFMNSDAEPVVVPLKGRGAEPFTVAGSDTPTGSTDDFPSGSGDFVRSESWKLARRVNLGPKSGNSVGPNDMVVDRRRNRGLVLGVTVVDSVESEAISVVNLQLNVVTNVVSRTAMGVNSESWGYPAIHGSRNELYMMGHNEFLQVIDLNTFSLKKEIDLGGEARQGRWFPRILLVDEWENRLFLVDGITWTDYSHWQIPEKVAKNVLVVDLASGQVVKQISVNAPMDMALDPSGQTLYLGNGQDRTIEILDLGDSRIRDTIQLELVPHALLIDPQEPYLYVFVKEPIPTSWETDLGTLLRIDLRTNTVDGEISVFPDGPHMVVDGETRTLWSISSKGGGSARYKVDLEDFQLLFARQSFLRLSGLGLSPDDGDGLALESSTGLLYRLNPADGWVKSRVELGADPGGVSVSEVNNQVLILRGAHGGFFVLNETGDLVNTIEGGWSSHMVGDEFVDRLFVGEKIDDRDLDAYADEPVQNQVAVYELSTLRLVNRTVIAGLELTAMKPDHERGVLWVMVNGTDRSDLHKLDLLSGELLGSRHFDVGLDMMELAPDTSKAYATFHIFSGETARSGKVNILDMVNQIVVGTIDLLPHFEVDPTDGCVLNLLGIDLQRNRLYVSSTGDDERVAVIDTEQDEVIEVLDLPGFNQRGYSFDFEGNTVVHPAGRIVDLETLEEQSFVVPYSGLSRWGARNRRTNIIYTANHLTGELVISLGPAGTEVPPPPVPGEVVAAAGDEEVVLSWAAVEDPSLVGYHVYRRDRVDGDFTRITYLPLEEASYTDLDLTNGQTYTYRLSSVGTFALEGIERTEPVSAVPKSGPTFQLVVLRKSVSVAQDKAVSTALGTEALEGFDEEVTLSAEAPEDVEVSFEPARVVPPRVVELRVRAGRNAPLGRSVIAIRGESGSKTKTAEIALEVTAKIQEESVLTLELDQEALPLDIPLQVNGRLFPARATQIQLDFRAERSDTLITMTVDTDIEGGYRAGFLTPFTDSWRVTASWSGDEDFEGTASRTVEFSVTSGKTRITATSDLADHADLGWMATIKGRIYPSPGTVAVTLNVRRPDGTEEKIEGVLSSEEGFYGHDLRMDQQGLWELWTSWKGNDRLLGAVSSVMTVPVQTDVGRVILVACGRDAARDVFWPTANYLGNLAYRTFQRRRLLKEKVFYLNDRQDQDVDRDGFEEDVDAGATMAALSSAWSWAGERVSADSPLYVYLVGRGTPAGLEVGEGEILSAAQFGQDLAALEERTGASCKVIVDAAHAGNFIRELSQQGRHVIASTGPGLAFYQAEGYLSFSQYFLTDLYQGKSVQESFLHTDQILRNLPGGFRQQDPGLEAEGNLIANQPGDYLATMDAMIGAPFELGDLSPQIRSSSLAASAGGVAGKVVTQTVPISEDGQGPQLKLAKPLAQQGVEISARIDDAEGSLSVVRAMIIPPASDALSAITEYPEVELTDADGDGNWVGAYADFLEDGVYPVVTYAIDGAGNAAEPMRTTVLVETPDDLATVAAEEQSALPLTHALEHPYPNPFNSEVVLKYALPEAGEVRLVVYNVLGQAARRLVEGECQAGHHQMVWDGRDDDGRGLATGVYVVRMQAGPFQQVRKVALVR